MLVELLIQIIHLVFSVLWWSITFFVLFIIRPFNKQGNFSCMLPKVQKVIILISSISFVSGMLLFFVISNFQITKLFLTLSGKMILVGGLLALPVYCYIIFNKLNKTKRLVIQKTFIPYVLFIMLTSAMVSMIIASKIPF